MFSFLTTFLVSFREQLLLFWVYLFNLSEFFFAELLTGQQNLYQFLELF